MESNAEFELSIVIYYQLPIILLHCSLKFMKNSQEEECGMKLCLVYYIFMVMFDIFSCIKPDASSP
jgi:hypothetical protein